MISDRIILFLELKKITINAFERENGMSNSSFRKALKNGKLSSEQLEALLSYFPDLDPTWLLTGRGTPLSFEDPAKPAADERTDCPIVNDCKCLKDILVGKNNIGLEYITFPKRLVGEGLIICVPVKDFAMYPTYNAGYVVVRLLPEIPKSFSSDDVYYIVSKNNTSYIGRPSPSLDEAGTLIISFDHPDRSLFPDISVKLKNIATIWKAVWYLTPNHFNFYKEYSRRLKKLEDQFEKIID